MTDTSNFFFQTVENMRYQQGRRKSQSTTQKKKKLLTENITQPRTKDLNEEHIDGRVLRGNDGEGLLQGRHRREVRDRVAGECLADFSYVDDVSADGGKGVMRAKGALLKTLC